MFGPPGSAVTTRLLAPVAFSNSPSIVFETPPCAASNSCLCHRKMSKPKACLLDLPGELRNRIYQYVLIEDYPIQAMSLQWNEDRTCHHYVPCREPATLLACTTFRHEASFIYYGSNVVNLGKVSHLWLMSEATQRLARWVRSLGDNAKYLRHVDIAVNCEILGPKHAAYSLRDFWETLRLQVIAHAGNVEIVLTGVPTLDTICVCDLEQDRAKQGQAIDGQVADTLLEASRRYFKTTELDECEACNLPRLRDPQMVNGRIYVS